jgi:hypothetical protein
MIQNGDVAQVILEWQFWLQLRQKPLEERGAFCQSHAESLRKNWIKSNSDFCHLLNQCGSTHYPTVCLIFEKPLMQLTKTAEKMGSFLQELTAEQCGYIAGNYPTLFQDWSYNAQNFKKILEGLKGERRLAVYCALGDRPMAWIRTLEDCKDILYYLPLSKMAALEGQHKESVDALVNHIVTFLKSEWEYRALEKGLPEDQKQHIQDMFKHRIGTLPSSEQELSECLKQLPRKEWKKLLDQCRGRVDDWKVEAKKKKGQKVAPKNDKFASLAGLAGLRTGTEEMPGYFYSNGIVRAWLASVPYGSSAEKPALGVQEASKANRGLNESGGISQEEITPGSSPAKK